MHIETRVATSADVDDAADVLADAFGDYPWTRWTVDAEDHVHRIRELQRMTLVTYGLTYGHVWVTTVDERIATVAIWMDSAVAIPEAVHIAAAAETARLEGRRHAASVATEEELDGLRPPGRHLYLGGIGTASSMQGQGLAGRSLAVGLAHADRLGIAAYLETSASSNVELYTRYGFTVVAHRQITGGGPDVWAMVRSAGSMR